MPTNEERREVARELRRTARDTLNGYSFQRAVEGIAFGTIGDRTWRQTLTRLADLIEPEPDPERTCCYVWDEKRNAFVCDQCGGSVLYFKDHLKYCFYCGAKVVD